MDDWDAEVDEDAVRHQTRARSTAARSPRPSRCGRWRSGWRLPNPVLVVGPDVDASGAWDAAVALAEKQRLPVWATPAPGGGRIGFPEDHPAFQGILAPAIGPLAEMLEGHDLILVAGSSVFPYYPNIPGPLLPEGAALVAITSDPDEAARAPMGDAIVADVALDPGGAGGGRRRRCRPRGAAGSAGARGRRGDRPDEPVHRGARALASVFPDDGIVVLESPSATPALRNQLRVNRPGSYYFGAGGGLGFGLAAAIGVQLAQPDRPVVCVVGEGSAQYAITGFWTAAAYSVPVTFLVLRNEEYAILKWFGMLENVTGAPGLDLPALDVSAVASGYGVPSRRVSGREELTEALRTAIGSGGPGARRGAGGAGDGAGLAAAALTLRSRPAQNEGPWRPSTLYRCCSTAPAPAIAAAASRPVNTQPPRNVPSSDFFPCTPPPPKPAASPTA